MSLLTEANPLLAAAHLLRASERPPVDHATWCRENLPDVFNLPFGPHHLHLFSQVGARPRGARSFTGAPRGSGKTSTAIFGIPLSVIAQGTHRFVVIVRATQDEADAAVMLIRAEIERNTALTEAWPRLALRRRKPGSAKEEKNRQSELLLSGGVIRGLGANAKLRGLVRRGEFGGIIRPDLFVFDDIEDAEQARSKLRTDRLEEWLFADVGQLGGNLSNGAMDVVGIGTTIDTDALATRAIRSKGRFASWTTAAFPAERLEAGRRVAAWPDGQPLRVLDALLDPSSETFVGTFTYAKEYLLDPRRRSDARVRAEWLRYGRAPADLEWAALGIDPAATERAVKGEDWSALVETGLDPDGQVWVRRTWRGHVSSRRLFDVAEDFATDDTGSQVASIAYEAVAGFAWGVQELRRRGLGHRGVQPRGDKVSRFEPVALMYEAGVIVHDESLRGSEFEEELLDFPGGEHDDYVDALVYSIMLSTNQGRRARRQREAS